LDISAAIDPKLAKNPAPPPADLPRLSIRMSDLAASLGFDSQPELTAAVQSMPRHLQRHLRRSFADSRSHLERTLSWLRYGEALGAVTIRD
jgi:hypothetical protein